MPFKKVVLFHPLPPHHDIIPLQCIIVDQSEGGHITFFRNSEEGGTVSKEFIDRAKLHRRLLPLDVRPDYRKDRFLCMDSEGSIYYADKKRPHDDTKRDWVGRIPASYRSILNRSEGVEEVLSELEADLASGAASAQDVFVPDPDIDIV